MSLLDKASLIVTPNAYKESKLYSVIPTSGAGDMTVVRATTATRKNSAGFIEEVPRNLAQYSEQFDNAYWVKNAVTITPNAITAPNGIVSADKLVENTSNTLHYLNLPPSTTPQGTNTISVYAKADGRNWIWLYFFDGVLGSLTAYFNISNGTLGTVQSGLTANILSVGNGWYRCSITRTQANAGNGGFGLGTANNVQSYLGNGTSGAYIWGNQLEVGSTATEYFPTTNRLNVPRIDYTNGSCPSLLVEPQRTNIQLNSEDFSQSSWTKTLSAVVANQINSPSGILSADKLNETATTGNHQLESSRNVTAGAYSMSVFAKKAEREWLYLFEDTTGKGAYFNLNNGTIGTIAAGATAKIENFGNGWYRCTVNYTEVGNFGRYRIAVTTGNGVSSYAGVANNGIYIWGAQYEGGAYATSYIPTVASIVTRNADVISKTGISSLIGQTEGTVFFDGKLNDSLATTKMIFQLTDGTDNNRIQLSSFATTLFMYIIKNNVAQLNISYALPNFTDNKKIAFVYSNNNFKLFVNGVLVSTNTTLSIPNTSVLNIGSYSIFGQNNFLNINSKQLYKTALTDAECIALTTI